MAGEVRVGVLGLTHDHIWGNLRDLNALPQGKLVAEETVDSDGFETLFEDLPPKPTRSAGIPRVVAPGTDGGTSTGPSAPSPNPSPQPA
jgi:hypothetical protein